jgi:uncharacterized membrane protein YjjP (DUF1212 family)
MVILLIFLDMIDTRFIYKDNKLEFTILPSPLKMTDEIYKKYEYYDKLVDFFQYTIALILVYKIIPNNWRIIILFFYLWRLIGLIIYYYINKNFVFVIFLDLIKELLFFSVFIKFSTINLIIIIILKSILVEIPHHMFKNNLYKDLFFKILSKLCK